MLYYLPFIGLIVLSFLESYPIRHFWLLAYRVSVTVFRKRLPFRSVSFRPSPEIKSVLLGSKGHYFGRYRIVNETTIFFYRFLVLDISPRRSGNIFPFHGIITTEGSSVLVRLKPRLGPLLICVGFAGTPAIRSMSYPPDLAMTVPISIGVLAFFAIILWLSAREAMFMIKEILSKEEYQAEN